MSNTLLADFCVDALEEALRRWGKPQIFNTNQGSQFTSHDFLKPLISNEHLYLKTYSDGHSLYQGLTEYFHFYNYERKHQSLGYQTPAMWFEERIEEKEKVQFLGVIQQA